MPIDPRRDILKLTKWRTTVRTPIETLGGDIVSFFKAQEKKQKKFGRIGEAWLSLVPAALQEPCELVNFARGTLTVIVGSSPAMYQLKEAMLNGLQDQLIHACRGEGLRKITLKPGRVNR
ncbi:MAG TPA: DciA family protein [Tepidisphaeraceae bacterium]|jgi:hypothetical protein